MSHSLRSGSTVAIIGAGVSGCATAISLLSGARTRGKSLQVAVFQDEGGRPGAPLVLTQECRARLSTLGCSPSPALKDAELEAVEVLCGDERVRLQAPREGLWVLDGREEQLGRQRLERSLRARAALDGAQLMKARAERVELLPDEEPELVVRSSHAPTRCDAAVLAAGAGSSLGDRFFPRFRGADWLPSVSAWVETSASHSPWAARAGTASLFLSPCPSVDGLWLVPCRGSIFACAFGAGVNHVGLCRSLVVASRAELLRSGFRLERAYSGALPMGVGRRLVAHAQLAVGSLALGHPLSIELAPSLATCSRAASALLDGGLEEQALRQSYLNDGIGVLRKNAAAAAKAFRWLLRSGNKAASAIGRAARVPPKAHSAGAGVLARSTPSAHTLLSHARRAGLLEALERSLFVDQAPVEPPPAPEPNLFYVVEDDPAVRDTVCSYLEHRGAVVAAFSDELSLCSAVAHRPPAAILLDVVLPNLDGLRLCEELKRHPSTRAVRVLLTSGLELELVRQQALKVGAETFLPKPVVPSVLWAALTGSLEQTAPAPGQPVAVSG